MISCDWFWCSSWLLGNVECCIFVRSWSVVQGILGMTSGMESWTLLEEAVSMLTVVPVGVTNLERQSAALFLAPDIHSEEMLYVASSKLHLLTLLLVFLLKVYGNF